jgi:fructoselysine-6-P-deglycase FrlB-like protein
VAEKMSFVEEALRSQRKTLREIAQGIVKEGVSQNLPPQPPKRIILIGVGSSLFSAHLSGLTLMREQLRKPIQVQIPIISCSSVDIGLKVIPARGDWVFGLSHRGRTEVTLRALEVSSEAGAFTVLVTARDVVAAPFVRFTLPTSSLEKCEPHTVGMTSAICATTTFILGSPMADQWSALTRQSDPNLEVLQKDVEKGPTVLLGEWEGEWIAREISLKLTEMAQLRVPAYGTEEFFHGPQVLSKSLGEQEKIWYVPVPGDQRSSQVKDSYRTKGGKNHSISWVSALIDLQWRVLAVALNLGKNPDGII